MTNNIIISTSEINPFWKWLQKSGYMFLNDLRAKGWDATVMMHAEIDDDKVHLDHKLPTDSTKRVR